MQTSTHAFKHPCQSSEISMYLFGAKSDTSLSGGYCGFYLCKGKEGKEDSGRRPVVLRPVKEVDGQ